MSDDRLRPGGALEGRLFRGFLQRLSEAREPEPGDRIGAWRIKCELGRGGSGVVFLAERADGAYSQQVALKWLRSDRPVPGGREVLRRERELLAGLDHPNIARLVDGGETDDGMLWFALDYVDGETIDGAAARLHLTQRLSLISTLCRAVHHAHRRGLIHGDIKPSNVMVDGRGRPRLLDFGISRLKGAGFGGSYGLTPDYASPEQRRRESLTTASDIWQLGRLLEDIVGNDRVPGDLRAIAVRATVGSPKDRYHSAAAMGADIDAWLRRRPVAAHHGGPGYRLSCLVRRNRLVSAVSGTALAIIVVGGVWMTLELADERDRAEAALADTEAVLARAEALGAFLTDLFRATRPDRPRDQLPSTEEILERGAERAMGPDAAPPGERFDMLSTIGAVYRARGRYDDARPLLEIALELANGEGALSPLDAARARQRLARLMIASGDPLEDAEALLLEAEGLLAGEADSWAALARVRITRTWIERHRGRHDRALALVEPLFWQMPPPQTVSASIRAGLFDSLAGLVAADGDLDRAAQFRNLALDAFREAQGPEGQGYVVSLANSVGLEFARGHFQEAERRAREALALYDRIYTHPVDYRASLRRTLARLLLNTGRVDEAFATLRQSGNEYARARDLEAGQWPLYFSTRGHFNARLGNHDAAVADLERARDLLSQQQEDFDRPLILTADLLLAWTRCRQGDNEKPLLDKVEAEASLLARPRQRALLREARATCRWRAGDTESALDEIRPLVESDPGPTGLVDAADRRIVAARMLAELGRHDRAADRLDEAADLFVGQGLREHPLLVRIRAARRALH